MHETPRPRVRGPGFLAALVLLAAASVPAGAQEPDQDLYARGVDLYQEGSYEQALQAMESLRSGYPESSKGDDALYYIGRSYARLDQFEQAEAAFRAVLALESTNRRVEAAYELGRILYRRKDYAGVVALLEPLKKQTDLDHEDDDLALLLGKTHYSLGIVAKNEKRTAQARESLLAAASVYAVVTHSDDRPRSRQEALFGLAKTYTRLADVADGAAEARRFRQEALRWIEQALPGADESDSAELRDLRQRVESRRTSRVKAEVELLGGTDALTFQPGLRAAAAGSMLFEPSDTQSLELKAGLEHDSLTLKTFNFTAAERYSGDGRLLQRTDNLSADLVWRAGGGAPLSSRLTVHGDYTLAEDPEHSNLDLSLSEALDWRPAASWKLGLDGSLAWTTYPAYTVNGRELDSVELAASPHLTWYAAEALRLELGYEYALKQYLNATYDTAVFGVDSTQNRRYHTHSADLSVKARLGEVFRPSLSYAFRWNDSVNYDVWVEDAAGPPGQFVEGYNDYYENTVELGLDFRWGPRLRTDLSGSAGYRSYLTYPARDAANTFTGALRHDLDLAAGLEASYLLASREAGQFGDLALLLRADYRQSISNMLFEDYFDTNYLSLAVFGGLGLKY